MTATYPKLPASIADIAKLFRKLNDIEFTPYDILLMSHGYLLSVKMIFLTKTILTGRP